ncbi:MAG: DUF5671 domain-containing protein [Candidatus Sungiibacteriota bacterium]
MILSHRSFPRDVFVHLLMIATLYATIAAFLALIFQYINVVFPDALGNYYPGILDTIRRSEAILLIVFPVYLFLSWLIGRDIIHTPDLRDFKLRKWLIYFTLFISAISIIIDLVILIYNFLGGELTTPFIFKIFAVFAAAAAVFGYYLWDLRLPVQTPTNARSPIPRIAAITATIIIFLSLIAGFFIVGSPQTQRDRRFDEQRINHLQIIQSQIVYYWQNKEKLPASLDDLQDDISGFTAPADPEQRTRYEYHAAEDLSFELCAVFAKEGDASVHGYSSLPIMTPERAYPMGKPYGANDNWSHGAGRVCFSRTIDPELYKPQKPISQ